MSEQVSLNGDKWHGGTFNVGIESTIRTDSSKYNHSTQIAQIMHEKVNTIQNYQVIINAIKSGRARDIADEPKAIINENGEKMPCIIIGSGPSLDDSIEYLREWKGGIICTSSHALTLMHFGIEPTHILALDAFCTWDEIKGVDWSKTRTKLITHPGMWPTLLENWPNEMLLYIENNGRPDSFYSDTQKIMYSHREGGTQRNPVFHYYIRTEIMLFACSPPLQLFVADILGYGTIYTCGVDFGFHSGKERFTSWDFDENNIWQEHKHPFEMNERIVKTNNGLYSEEMHIYYKKNFLSSWRLSNKTMYTTDHGIITETPYIDITDLIVNQGYNQPQQSSQWIADNVEPYLALVGAFVIETPKGLSFVESNNYQIELPNFMREINKRYQCPKCKVQLLVKDNDSHVGSECPQCHEGKLEYEIGVDIKQNMARIERYIEMSRHINIDKY